MNYDFIVAFTLFTRKGFRTMYRHFDNLDIAKMFASNVNIKDNHKIYADLKYVEDKIKAKIEEFKIVRNEILKNENELNRKMITEDLVRNDYCEKMLQELLENLK